MPGSGRAGGAALGMDSAWGRSCQSSSPANRRPQRRDAGRAGAVERGAVTVAAGSLFLFAAGSWPGSSSGGGGGGGWQVRRGWHSPAWPAGAISTSCGAVLPRSLAGRGSGTTVVRERPQQATPSRETGGIGLCPTAAGPTAEPGRDSYLPSPLLQALSLCRKWGCDSGDVLERWARSHPLCACCQSCSRPEGCVCLCGGHGRGTGRGFRYFSAGFLALYRS